MNQLVFPSEFLRQLGGEIFSAFGAPKAEATLVADHLVEASLMGLESHGVTRYVFYSEELKNGRLQPGAVVSIEKETPTTAIVDGHSNFGQVVAQKMTDVAIEKATQHGLSCVVSRNSHHTGRLGAWTTKIAEANMIGIATISAPKLGHYMVPWGGREGRLATNPISWAAPTENQPLVLDMTCSAISEGKVRECLNAGELLPEGRVIDAQGRLTRDPKAFYGPPHGAFLPFGGEFGYKAYGLGLLPMVLGEMMIGEKIDDEVRYINALTLIVINPKCFGDLKTFLQHMKDMVHYVKDTPLAEGYQEVLLPGEREYQTYAERKKTGIPLPQKTWDDICRIAKEVNIPIDQKEVVPFKSPSTKPALAGRD